jgi:hypothetical protein
MALGSCALRFVAPTKRRRRIPSSHRSRQNLNVTSPASRINLLLTLKSASALVGCLTVSIPGIASRPG